MPVPPGLADHPQVFKDEKTGEVWVQAPVRGAEPGEVEWIVLYRVELEAGHAVVTEVRIQPYDPARTPSGGLSARHVRSDLNLHVHEDDPALRADVYEALELRAAQDLTWEGELVPPATRVRPGRGGRPRRFLAHVAARYVQLLVEGDSKPSLALGDWLRDHGLDFSDRTVRNLVAEARQAGLLTPAPAKGKAGGWLTPEAYELVGTTQASRKATKGGAT